MTEFTSEWIAQTREQLKLVSPLPWKACSCSKCGMITGEKDLIAVATRGNWGDNYPIIKPVGGSIGGQYEVVMEQITYGHIPPETGNINAQYIAEACNNYPEALDEIERLQKRIEELEIYENKNQSAKEVGIYWVQKLREEEARADLHANLNRKIANALGKKINENWSDIPEIVVQLKQRIEELEQERRWIPVSERNPTETGNYFVVCKKEYVGTIRPIIDHFNCQLNNWINTEKYITHWQERPQPPKDGE